MILAWQDSHMLVHFENTCPRHDKKVHIERMDSREHTNWPSTVSQGYELPGT